LTHDVILRGGTIITPTTGFVGDVAIDGDTIAGLGQILTRAQREIDCRGTLVMPGFINLHCHSAMVPLRGLGEDVPDRLTRVIWPLERDLVDADFVRLGGAFGLVEQALAGVTTVADMYYHADTLADLADRIGLRLIAGQALASERMPDALDCAAGLARAGSLAARWRGHPRITPALAPHAPHSLTDADLAAVRAMSERLDLPVLIHLAETPAERRMIEQRGSASPTAHLAKLGLLNPLLIAAHCIDIDDDDIALLADAHVAVAHCVGANTKAAKGTAPLLRLLAGGAAVGLGTDGPMSGNTLDVLGQLAQVAKTHKLLTGDRSVLPAQVLVGLATAAAADAISRPDLGRLSVGAKADIVILDLDHPAVAPAHDPWSTLVYAASPRDVRTVIVDGRIIVEDRRVLGLDLGGLQEPLQRLAEHCRQAAFALA
jgi:cytosine/adenosine deaminase-related metal-dependent hydrolase